MAASALALPRRALKLDGKHGADYIAPERILTKTGAPAFRLEECGVHPVEGRPL
jgi:hypothetical protein